MEQSHHVPLSACGCQNPHCPDVGKKGGGNLAQHSWVDRTTRRIRNLRCRTCKKECSERKGTPWYRAQLSEATAVAIAKRLAEGAGVRKTARLLGTHHETVIRWNRKLGEHGKALHEERVRPVGVKEAQADEMWAFVGKKEARCDRTDPADDHEGSQGDHTVVDAQTKLAVSVVIGPRTSGNAEALWDDVAHRTDHRLPTLITTDEYRPYQGAILTA